MILLGGLKKDTQIISGGATGIDTLVRMLARRVELPFTEYIPDWVTYGKSAGFQRNRLLVEQADIVIALWDGSSAGTLDTIEQMTALDKTVYIITPSTEDSTLLDVAASVNRYEGTQLTIDA